MANLSLTLADVKRRVKRQFGDTAAVQITDPDIVDWVNQAARDLIRKNNLNKKRAVANTTANTPMYTLPVGIVSLMGVKYQGKTLQQLSQEEADQYIPYDDATVASGIYPAGIPTHFWLYDNSIFLYPAPQTTGASDLLLYYTAVNANGIANDADDLLTVLGLPVEYHNRVVEYCLAQAYELDGNTQMFQLKMQQYETGNIGLLGTDIDSEPPFYESIVALPSDFGDFVEYGYN